MRSARRDAGDGWLRVWPLRKPALKALAVGFGALLAIWAVAGLLYMWLLDDTPVGDADRSIATWFESKRTDTANTWSTIGNAFSDTVVKVILVLVVGGTMVAIWKRWHDGVFLATVVIFEASVFVVTSFIVGRERPPVERLEQAAPSGSFPSGHAAAAVAFYGGLLVIGSWHTRRRSVRVGLTAVAVLVPLIVSVARVYRGMHHPIDVIAGMALGFVSILVVQSALRAGVADIRRDVERRDSARPLPDRLMRLDRVGTEGGQAPTAIEMRWAMTSSIVDGRSESEQVPGVARDDP